MGIKHVLESRSCIRNFKKQEKSPRKLGQGGDEKRGVKRTSLHENLNSGIPYSVYGLKIH